MFVSFSMPEALMAQTAHDAANHNIPLVLNGLANNSMKETMQKILNIAESEKDASIEINPIVFKKYGINRVPSLVVDDGKNWDVIYGNIKIENALEIISQEGDTSKSVKTRQQGEGSV